MQLDCHCLLCLLLELCSMQRLCGPHLAIAAIFSNLSKPSYSVRGSSSGTGCTSGSRLQLTQVILNTQSTTLNRCKRHCPSSLLVYGFCDLRDFFFLILYFWLQKQAKSECIYSELSFPGWMTWEYKTSVSDMLKHKISTRPLRW